MHPKIKKFIASLSLAMACHCAFAQAQEDFLQAPDRIEWDAGGLYDGRFADGTPFQIELAYARPASLPADVVDLRQNAYWYPRHFTGKVLALKMDKGSANELALSLMPLPGVTNQETFSITLAPDKLNGQGTWASASLDKQLSFSLQRRVLYRAVALTRPSPEEQENRQPKRFVFSTVFPLMKNEKVNAWVRDMAGVCQADLECYNSVKVRWYSDSLVSLDASAYDYNLHAAHGNRRSTMRHYMVKDGKMTEVGLDAFLDPSAACRAKASTAIVSKLRAQDMSWADKGALNDQSEPKFIPLPTGIEFHWDPYEVGSYVQGSPSVFLTRAELGNCVRNLPRL